jgi:hypothetical protein
VELLVIVGRTACRSLALLVLGACAAGACHFVLPYEHRDAGSDAAREHGVATWDGAHEDGFVSLDARWPDAGDFRAPIPDAGAACVAEVALWVGTCRLGGRPDTCGIGCGAYTVVCAGAACSCAITDGDSHVCKGIAATTADCAPTSACFEAVATGCCVWQ